MNNTILLAKSKSTPTRCLFPTLGAEKEGNVYNKYLASKYESFRYIVWFAVFKLAVFKLDVSAAARNSRVNFGVSKLTTTYIHIAKSRSQI